jgi:putative transposase
VKKSRFSEEQMVKILREADRAPVGEVAKRHGVSEQTIYAWRKRFGQLEAADLRRLRQLEQENGRLKKLVAERDLETEVMREIAAKNGDRARTQAAGGVRLRAGSVVAPGVSPADRGSIDASLRVEAGAAGRAGSRRDARARDPVPALRLRRILVYLDRRGMRMSPGRPQRIWRRAGLQVPRRRPRRRIAANRPRPLPASGVNQVWAYDFVHDACANGQALKCLTVIDEYTRECLALEASGSIGSGRVMEVLAKLVSVRGAPRHLRSVNGPEFVSRAILRWLRDEQIETALIDPGKPWQNGANESFNGKLRDECLGMHWFQNRTEARVVIEDWRRGYNEDRPHSEPRASHPERVREAANIQDPGRSHFPD